MIKKTIATVVALTLLFSLVPALPVWADAGDPYGIRDSKNPFDPAPDPSYPFAHDETDRVIKLKVNPDAIVAEDATPGKSGSNMSAITAAHIEALNDTVAVSTLPTGFSFASPSTEAAPFYFESDGAYVSIRIPPQGEQKKTYTLKITLSDATTTIGTASISTGDIAVVVEPVSTAIKSINNWIHDHSDNYTIVQGEDIVIPYPTLVAAPNPFTNYNSSAVALSDSIVGTYVNYTLSDDSQFGLSITDSGFKLTPKSLTPGVYNSGATKLKIKAAAKDGNTTTSVNSNWSFDINGTITVDGLLKKDAGTAIVPIDTITSPMAAGSTYTFRAPASNFNGSYNLASLATANVIPVFTNASGTVISGTAVGEATLKFTAVASNGDVTITMYAPTTAASNASIPNGTRIALKDNNTTFGTAGVRTNASYEFKSALSIVNAVPVADNKITGIAGGFSSGNYWVTDTNGKTIDVELDDIIEGEDGDGIFPGDEIYIHLKPSFFSWEQAAPVDTALVTKKAMSDGKITLKPGTLAAQIESIKFKTLSNNEQVISVVFAEPLVSTRSVPIKSTTVDILYDRKSNSGSSPGRLVIKGDIMNREQEVSYNNESVDVDYAPVIVAENAVSNLEVYLGNGVTVTLNRLSRNGKVYGHTTMGPDDDEDDSVFDKYDVDDVIELFTIGLSSSSGNNVELDLDENYYVYDKNMNYLGRSGNNKKFPYSQKYYLSIKDLKIPMAGDPGSTSQIPDNTDPGAGGTGGTGGGTAPVNGTMNPYTGR